MTEISLPVSITYDTSGTTPIPDIIAALQAADAAIQDAVSLLPSFIDGLKIDHSTVRVRLLSQESPLKELFIVGIIAALQSDLQREVPQLVEEVLNVDIPAGYDSIITFVVAIVLVYGASFLKDAAIKAVEDSALRRQLSNMIEQLGKSTNKTPEEIKRILDAKYGAPNSVKRIANTVGKFFTPSQREGAKAVTFDRERIDPEVIREVPYPDEFSAKEDFERYQSFNDVRLEIHAQDKDKINTGWAAVPVGLSERRLKMKLVEPVLASDIWTKSTIFGDITLVSKLSATGYIPQEIHLLRIIDK